MAQNPVSQIHAGTHCKERPGGDGHRSNVPARVSEQCWKWLMFTRLVSRSGYNPDSVQENPARYTI